MSVAPKDTVPSEDAIIRLRAKLEDDRHTIVEEGGQMFLAHRVKGEAIDLLRSLERMSEHLDRASLEGVENLVLISDRNVEVLPMSILVPKLEAKEKDDLELSSELREKLTKHLAPIVFTTENDILELYRTAVRMEGSCQRTDTSIGLDLAKTDIPREADIVYLIFDDGFRKMDLKGLDDVMDSAVSSLREGVNSPKAAAPQRPFSTVSRPEEGALKGPTGTVADLTDPKVIAREFSKNIISLGYRKDAVFSRNDANQFFFIGMNLPAVFFKVLEDEEELSSFLRVLSHRRDAVGILITREWSPRMEALSYKHGFIYLEAARAHLAHEVVMGSFKEGGPR